MVSSNYSNLKIKYLHTVVGFQVFLSNTNNLIWFGLVCFFSFNGI